MCCILLSEKTWCRCLFRIPGSRLQLGPPQDSGCSHRSGFGWQRFSGLLVPGTPLLWSPAAARCPGMWPRAPLGMLIREEAPDRCPAPAPAALWGEWDKYDSTPFPSEIYLTTRSSIAVIRKYGWWLQHSLFHNKRKKRLWPHLSLKDSIFPTMGVGLNWHGEAFEACYFSDLLRCPHGSGQPAVPDVLASNWAPQEHHLKDRKETRSKRKPAAHSQPEFLALAVRGAAEVQRLILEWIWSDQKLSWVTCIARGMIAFLWPVLLAATLTRELASQGHQKWTLI